MPLLTAMLLRLPFVLLVASLLTACSSPSTAQRSRTADLAAPTGLAPDTSKTTVTVYYFSYNRGKATESDAQTVAQAVEDAFVQTRRFTMIERQKLGQLSELEMTDEILVEGVMDRGKKLGVDYVVMGNVDAYDATRQMREYRDDKGNIRRRVFYVGTLTLTLKLVDIGTGEILASERLSNSSGGLFGFESEAAAKASLLRGLRGRIEDFITKFFPLEFHLFELNEVKRDKAQTLTITGGTFAGVQPGDVFEVHSVSQIDGFGERKRYLGMIRVMRVEGEHFSYCKVVRGKDEIYHAFTHERSNIQVSKIDRGW